jgi:hypothetical protein
MISTCFIKIAFLKESIQNLNQISYNLYMAIAMRFRDICFINILGYLAKLHLKYILEYNKF